MIFVRTATLLDKA